MLAQTKNRGGNHESQEVNHESQEVNHESQEVNHESHEVNHGIPGSPSQPNFAPAGRIGNPESMDHPKDPATLFGRLDFQGEVAFLKETCKIDNP